jgi:hypothetical protein
MVSRNCGQCCKSPKVALARSGQCCLMAVCHSASHGAQHGWASAARGPSHSREILGLFQIGAGSASAQRMPRRTAVWAASVDGRRLRLRTRCRLPAGQMK